ncbi:TPA: T3SS effector NleG family protein [Escherichia albertii]|nr:T3SS effector NleG family protein [Escherichia albertii]HEB1257279.1 T3SS effector NleG family protein [Escherichia albertii]HEB1309551.1 T3SS effector NleG family protein [Escherichia albertii]HEB1312619.1 T3SS effector NleG family protein [Escherichia albertii]HEB1314117.1 T3SS effector NleG family protein [Escherichia albertii]
MPIDLTAYVLPEFKLLFSVPDEVLSEIRNQSAAGEAQIQLGELMVSIRPMSIDGFFMGSINQNGLSEDSILMGLQHIEYLEREINAGGLTSSEVNMLREIEINVNTSLLPDVRLPRILDKIELCAFNVKDAELKGTESSLTCPITLCEPEDGVFMKNSLHSDICTLYDKSALMHLVNTGASHPISRESITASMIVKRDECYFDSEKENFAVKN